MYTVEQVREIFREWQSYSNKMDVLKPQGWETTDEDVLTRVSAQVALLKEAQIDVFLQGDRKQELERFFLHQRHNPKLSEMERAEMRENYRWFAHTAYVPRDLSARFQAMTADMEAKWAMFDEMKEEQGISVAWEQQSEYLEKAFAIRREMAIPVAEKLGIKPSEVTLDFWNPHFRSENIDQWIAELDEKVKPLVRQHYATQKKEELDYIPLPNLEEHMDSVHAMLSAVRDSMLEAGGWTKERLKKEGINVLPMTFGPNGFCWGDPSEIRMCTEFVGGNLVRGFGFTVHESTHLLYMLSRNEAPEIIKGTPLGHINGYSTHEVCAMSVEQTFYKKEFAPLIEELASHYLPEVALDENGKVRAEWKADNIAKIITIQDNQKTDWCDSEVSLLPNMVFRTLAERKIIDGELAVKDLPEFWSKTMEEWTGLPHDKSEFFVGESHWFDDNAGYFWAYQFGAMVGSTIYEQVQKLPKSEHELLPSYQDDLLSRVKNYFKPHLDYLDKHIFQKHCAVTPLEIAQEISGPNRSIVDSYRTYMQSLVENNVLTKNWKREISAKFSL